MIVGVFFPFDVLAVWFITICYLLCPKFIIERKNEYLKFFLLFLSAYFLLFLIVRFLLGIFQDYNIPEKSPRSFLLFLFAMGFCPAMFIANLIYPFKTVKRSQHLSFFLFLFSLCCIGILAVVWIGVAFFSNM